MTERTEPQARERDERSQGNRPSFALFVHSLGWFFLGSSHLSHLSHLVSRNGGGSRRASPSRDGEVKGGPFITTFLPFTRRSRPGGRR